MPTTYISTVNTGPGPRFTFAGHGDSLVILPGATLASTDGSFTLDLNMRNNISLTVLGTLYESYAIYGAGTGFMVNIGVGGQIVSGLRTSTVGTLFFSTIGGILINQGVINTPSTVAVVANDTVISNRGSITGSTGIYSNGATGNVIVNSGRIEATGFNVSLNQIFGNGIALAGGVNRITNLAGGAITAVAATRDGIYLAGDIAGSRIANDGLISSDGGFGIELADVITNSLDVIFNTGTIMGGAGAINGSSVADYLVNRGLLGGNVVLNQGVDIFDNRGGRVDGDVVMGEGDDVYNGMLDTWVTGEISGGQGNDTLFGGSNMDVIYGDDGNDRIVGFEGDDSLYGGAGNDNIAGREGQDLVDGGAGNDNISGGYGDDSVFGGTGSDTIQGNEGNDRLVGGAGGDFLYGGAGQDVFVFNGVSDSPFAVVADRDRIMDFVRGEDMIELTQIDANTTLAGDQAFTFIGAAAFSSVAGQLRYDAATGLVSGDVNGDGVADLAFAIITRPAVLSAADFFL